jgi:lipid-binding SYLF domain-containing protein
MTQAFRSTVWILLYALTLSISSFATAGWDPRSEPTGQSEGSSKASSTVARMKAKDPGMQIFFDKAYGYAIFPTVGKAGMGIGGAYGEGEVYRQGTFIGTATLTQLTVGFQFGGQAYSEIIFFKDKKTLDDFTEGNFELGAQASAIAVTAGVSADADYSNGVAVFTLPKKGLMYEATISGQKFSFEAAQK